MIFSKNSDRSDRAQEKRFVKNCYRFRGKNSSPQAAGSIRKKRRAELLAERKAKLAEIADSAAPDALVVFACLIYLRAYFGSERRMIYELIKTHAVWQIEKLQVKTEIRLERIYYRFLRGYTEKQWQIKLDAELKNFEETIH